MRVRILSAVGAATIVIAVSCSGPESEMTTPTSQPTDKGGATTGKVTSVVLSPSTVIAAVGATAQLAATASPPGSATSFAWVSSNNAVATVSQTGLVTGVAAGTATISVTASGKTGKSTVTVTAESPPPSGAVVLVGAGDIANCASFGHEATANLLDGISGTVITLGDNVYSDGTASEYASCYGPSWGRHKARTKPTPGNHEYNTPNATGYYGYFGAAAGDPAKGYYSYDLGEWHIIVLNSNSGCGVISCAAGSAQEQWLRADLAANAKACTLAYWHHPRFSSGATHGNNTAVAPFWDALYEAGAEIVLNGHEHLYERFAPQTPNAVADPSRGIRQFTVGTGGAGLYMFSSTIQPNSERRNNTSFGVLKLILRAGGYDWQFIPADGSTFTDSGSATCH